MSGISNREPACYVSYDRQDGRFRKFFRSSYKARQFYVMKLKAKANPAVEPDDGQTEVDGEISKAETTRDADSDSREAEGIGSADHRVGVTA